MTEDDLAHAVETKVLQRPHRTPGQLARQTQDEAARRSRDAFGRLAAGGDGVPALEVAADVALPEGVPTLDQAGADVVLRLLCGSADLAAEPGRSESVGVDVLVAPVDARRSERGPGGARGLRDAAHIRRPGGRRRGGAGPGRSARHLGGR